MFASHLFILLTLTSSTWAFNKTSKRGLAFADENTPGDLTNANSTNSQTSWVYDWSNNAPTYLAQSHLEFIPMQWGAGGIVQFQALVKRQGAKTILAFNEPDLRAQSNIKPEVAASLWKQYIQPLKTQGVRLGGPAVTGSPGGRDWLTAFFAACTGCTVDFLPIHWYGEGVGNFYDYIWAMHYQFSHLPLWVTEYASTSSNQAEVVNFLNASITYMDTLPWIERYAWFGFFRPSSVPYSKVFS